MGVGGGSGFKTTNVQVSVQIYGELTVYIAV